VAEGNENEQRGDENEQRDEASPEPVRRDLAEPPKSAEYSGKRLTSSLVASLVSLLVGLAWPATLLLLVYLLAHNGGRIESAVDRFMENRQSAEVSAGPKGLLIKIVQTKVQEGLSQQVKATQPGLVQDPFNLRQAAATATSQIIPSRRLETQVKVLWVDDHPQNNIGLQYAFEALGIAVICIDSNSGIDEAFATAKDFDVVITDMHRDGVRGEPDEREGGLKTIELIHKQHPKVPVIIYAGSYSLAHENEPVSTPVIANTYKTERVFKIVTDIAACRNAAGGNELSMRICAGAIE
jgi:CheY-like chemotaxis protein